MSGISVQNNVVSLTGRRILQSECDVTISKSLSD